MTPEAAAASVADERTTLHAVLDGLRNSVVSRVEGLDDDVATRPVGPSGSNLVGLVKHLAWVELYWFLEVFADVSVDYPYPGDDPGADMRPELGDTVDGVVALYRSHTARSDEVIASASPDDLSKGDQNGTRFSLRWVMTHMIEETARHAGHADLLRERADGVAVEHP